MKKFFTVLAVLLVATALFAGVTVKAGGTFAFASLSNATKEGSEAFGEEMKMKAHGFGFDAGIQYDLSDKLAVYGEFNMVFPSDAQIKEGEDDWESIKENFPEGSTYKINYFSVSAGVAYKLDFDAVKLAVGGGLSLNRSAVKFSYVDEVDEDINMNGNQSFTNIGLNALIDAKYMVAQNVGVGVTLNPQLGIYNISKAYAKYSDAMKEEMLPYVLDDIDDSVNGFKVSFAMPITVGVSYTF